MMTPSIGYATALVLMGVAAIRLREGLRIVRYQRSLRSLADYRLAADKIPVSKNRLFGIGFRWTDCTRSAYVTPSARKCGIRGTGYFIPLGEKFGK